MVEPKLYSELAAWWPLMSTPADYEEEAGFYTEILREACDPRTVLELGSGRKQVIRFCHGTCGDTHHTPGAGEGEARDALGFNFPDSCQPQYG